ncbi:Hok/Gef family protein [Escherichia coli]|nr:Hok/Gef family protein [Escherichia coli]EJN5156033.1 Hok/Gef family protein [Escherichia coli]EJW4878144.1 Hok/Gef family protein [Escherichia coli]EKJ0265851.1 Hok/Gef family protein [Escherichia coli]
MKQQKAMLIALIVICLTVIVTALVTRKKLVQNIYWPLGCNETHFSPAG